MNPEESPEDSIYARDIPQPAGQIKIDHANRDSSGGLERFQKIPVERDNDAVFVNCPLADISIGNFPDTELQQGKDIEAKFESKAAGCSGREVRVEEKTGQSVEFQRRISVRAR